MLRIYGKSALLRADPLGLPHTCRLRIEEAHGEPHNLGQQLAVQRLPSINVAYDQSNLLNQRKACPREAKYGVDLQEPG